MQRTQDTMKYAYRVSQSRQTVYSIVYKMFRMSKLKCMMAINDYRKKDACSSHKPFQAEGIEPTTLDAEGRTTNRLMLDNNHS